MRNDHHHLLHAFCVTLWVFSSPQNNASKVGFDLNNIIFHVPKKNMKVSKLAFSFALDCSAPKKF
jgi:hypothetical protein